MKRHYSANKYILKINNRNTRKVECSTLTIKTPKQRQWRCPSVFIFNYFAPFLVFLMLTLSMYLLNALLSLNTVEELRFRRLKEFNAIFPTTSLLHLMAQEFTWLRDLICIFTIINQTTNYLKIKSKRFRFPETNFATIQKKILLAPWVLTDKQNLLTSIK